MNVVIGGGKRMHPFCIYGAGIVAVSIYTALREVYNCIPDAFLVSEWEGNPTEIDGIPVRSLTEWDESGMDMVYLVATPEPYHLDIANMLFRKGVSDRHMVFIGSEMENKVMERFYVHSSLFRTIGEVLEVEPVKPSIAVFQAKSQVDKPLQREYPIPGYVYPVQAGAALSNQQSTVLSDDIGDNISCKNRNYCELTVGYYAWKHSFADYKGLCHYRRIFDISDGQMDALFERKEEWDTILPYPSIHYPDISGQHNRYVKEGDWDAMLRALKEKAPGYYMQLDCILRKPYFYNFNMLIARREVFDDYCSFLFPILERTEELVSPKGWERADRFAGYLGENLTTLYFMVNRDRWKIVHAGKKWLV